MIKMHVISDELLKEIIETSKNNNKLKLLLDQSGKETSESKVISLNLISLAEVAMKEKVKNYIDKSKIKDPQKLKNDYQLIVFAQELIPVSAEKLAEFMADSRMKNVYIENDFPDGYTIFDIARVSLINFLVEKSCEYIKQYLNE